MSRTTTTDLVVMGLGASGLPLASTAVRSGLQVMGFDDDPDMVSAVRSGWSYSPRVSGADIQGMLDRGFAVTSDQAALEGAQTVALCVPTPMGASHHPDLSFLVAAARALSRQLQPGTLVILESTVLPGTTEDVLRPILEESGLVVGQDVFLAYAPQSLGIGSPQHPGTPTTKLVAGCTPQCTERAMDFYRGLYPEVVAASGVRDAELVELLENTYRQVSLTLVNQFALICQSLQVDPSQVLRTPQGHLSLAPTPVNGVPAQSSGSSEDRLDRRHPEPATTGGRQRSLFRSRDFAIVWCAQLISRIGNRTAAFVLPLVILGITGSAATAGMVAAMERIPYLLLALPVGALVEHWNKRTVLVIGNACRAGVFGAAAAYLLGGGAQLTWLMCTVVLSGLIYVFYDAAKQTIFSRILSERDLPRGSGLLEGTGALSEAIAPTLGGLLVGIGTTKMMGAGYAFSVAAGSYLICGLALLAIRACLKPTHGPVEGESLASLMKDGLKFLHGHRELRRISTVNFINSAVYATLPLAFMSLARDSLHLSAQQIGYMLSAGAVCGALGSLTSGFLRKRLGTYGVIVLAGICWGAGELTLAMAPTVWIAMLGLVMVLWVAPPLFAVLYTHRMAIIPSELSTRLNGIYRLLTQTGVLVGFFSGGFIIDAIRPRGFLILAGSICLLTALVMQFQRPSVRAARHVRTRTPARVLPGSGQHQTARHVSPHGRHARRHRRQLAL